MDNRYSARSLTLRLGHRQIVNDVSLQLRGGEMAALIGPNGAGKSTLLRLLTGFLTPDAGERLVEGRPLESWSAEALSRRRAVMLQRTQLHADWPIETVIAMGRSPWGGAPNEEIIRRVMKETGCDHLAGRRYPSLSGGEQQRCSWPAVWRSCGAMARPRAGCFSMSLPRRWISIISNICCVCSNA
ncbi:ABC-type hemin transport system [Klebsiella grimontii]|nr:ABC-type hemin transport system [Klebsiella grimontii]